MPAAPTMDVDRRFVMNRDLIDRCFKGSFRLGSALGPSCRLEELSAVPRGVEDRFISALSRGCVRRFPTLQQSLFRGYVYIPPYRASCQHRWSSCDLFAL